MPEILHTIDKSGAHIIESSANGLTAKDMTRLFFGSRLLSIRNRTIELHKDLRLPAKLTELEMRTRAAAMAIKAGLLQEKDLKRPGKKYHPTMAPSEGSTMQVVALRDSTLVPSSRFTVPFRSHLSYDKSEVIPAQWRTYLSCLAWGMSRKEIAEQFAPDHLTDRQALRHVYTGLCRSFGMLEANNAPQAIAHASFMGVIHLDEKILNSQQIPMPDTYDNDAPLSLGTFRRAMPYRFEDETLWD